MKAIERNVSVEPLREMHYAQITLADQDFSVTYSFEYETRYILKCSCAQCGKIEDYPASIYCLKVEDITYKYKKYTAEEVLKAKQLVKRIFTRIIMALKRRYNVGKMLCSECYEEALDSYDLTLDGSYNLTEQIEKSW